MTSGVAVVSLELFKHCNRNSRGWGRAHKGKREIEIDSIMPSLVLSGPEIIFLLFILQNPPEPDRERQILYGITYMWNLKKKSNS